MNWLAKIDAKVAITAHVCASFIPHPSRDALYDLPAIVNEGEAYRGGETSKEGDGGNPVAATGDGRRRWVDSRGRYLGLLVCPENRRADPDGDLPVVRTRNAGSELMLG